MRATLSPLAAGLALAFAPTTDAGDAGANAEPAAPVSVLTEDQVRGVVGAAVDLSNMDRAYEGDTLELARVLGRIMGEKPSYEVWTEVQARFVARYKDARECTDVTAAKRWSYLVGLIGMDKPAKPTKAAETKAAQRSEAADAAAALIEKAKATTPAEVLALMTNTDEPIKPAVAQALAKRSAELATEATAAAREAARAEVKALRESIRKSIADLSLVQLREVAALVAKFAPVAEEPAEESAEPALRTIEDSVLPS